MSALVPTLAVFALAAIGLGLGLLIGRGPPGRGACGPDCCRDRGTCPRRRKGRP